MNFQNPTHLTIKEAQKILMSFSCLATKSVNSESERALLRQAVLLFTSLSDYQNLGVCADTLEQGLLALKTYIEALGYLGSKFNFDESPNTSLVGSVYIKFNSKRLSSYIEPYTGQYRGVLVSYESSEYELINGTYGHLPLDLF